MMIYVILEWVTFMILVVALKYKAEFCTAIDIPKRSLVSSHVMAELKTST
jgi:hypothetical protein